MTRARLVQCRRERARNVEIQVGHANPIRARSRSCGVDTDGCRPMATVEGRLFETDDLHPISRHDHELASKPSVPEEQRIRLQRPARVAHVLRGIPERQRYAEERKSTRLNSSHVK